MILQALVKEYDALVERGALERPGWQLVKVSFGLELDENGALVRVVPLQTPVPRGKKEVLAPQEMNVPAQVKRTVGIAANFLCDNASYFLGADAKGKPERAKECFAACRDLHTKILGGSPHPAARAVVRFFQSWRPEHVADNEALALYRDEVLAGGNLVFLYEDKYVSQIPAVREIWNAVYAAGGDGEEMRCLVTGERATIAKLHPSIKGVVGAQSSGASLVSFNAPAFESFGRDGEQGKNAPVSERAAFAYGAALNYLLTKEKHRLRLGDTTVVFWAEDAEPAYADLFSLMLEGERTDTSADLFTLADGDRINDDDLQHIMKKLARGEAVSWQDIPLDPDNRFYILGISPNAARLSVRFFLQDNFGVFACRIQEHHERLHIARPAYDHTETLSFWQLLRETINRKSQDKSPSPQLAGELMRAVLNGSRYPATLLNQTELRIRAEQEVTRGRAAILKAYLLKNTCDNVKFNQYKEALDVELNENTTYPPYVLGRMFAVLEGLQQAANPDINATIRYRYFNAACATPAVVFPQLIKLSQAHLRKLKPGPRVYHEKLMQELMHKTTADHPRRLDLYDQGIFQIGYYHQTQKRYEKKEDKNNG